MAVEDSAQSVWAGAIIEGVSRLIVEHLDTPERLAEALTAATEQAIKVGILAERKRCEKACADEIERARQFGPHHIPIITSIRDAITKGEA